MLIFAMFEFGRVVMVQQILTNAVREGARYGTLRNPQPPVDEVAGIVVTDVLGSGTNITQMTDFGLGNVTVEGQAADSEVVRVEATYDFDLWFGGIIGFRTITVTKDASMPRWRE
jgi:Flp pilus assembly protein TadG